MTYCTEDRKLTMKKGLVISLNTKLLYCFKNMRLKDLECELSQVDSFDNPKGECEWVNGDYIMYYYLQLLSSSLNLIVVPLTFLRPY